MQNECQTAEPVAVKGDKGLEFLVTIPDGASIETGKDTPPGWPLLPSLRNNLQGRYDSGSSFRRQKDLQDKIAAMIYHYYVKDSKSPVYLASDGHGTYYVKHPLPKKGCNDDVLFQVRDISQEDTPAYVVMNINAKKREFAAALRKLSRKGFNVALLTDVDDNRNYLGGSNPDVDRTTKKEAA